MRAQYRGLLFLFIMIYLFVPVPLVQWFGAAGIMIILLCYLYMRTVLSGLKVYRQSASLKTYRSQPLDVCIYVENRSRLPIPLIAVLDASGSLSGDEESRQTMSLRPYERREMHYSVKSSHRGRYLLGPIEIRVYDPLGFFARSFEVPSKAEVIVYPELYRLETLVREGMPSGNMRVSNPLFEDVTRFRSLREYMTGDEIRRINWKASARTGNLHVSEFMPTINFTGLICLNLRAEDYAQRGRYHAGERAVQAAAALVRFNLDRGQAVGIVTNASISGDSGDHLTCIPAGDSDQHGVKLLELLSCVDFSQEETSVFDLLSGRVETGSIIQYVGPQLLEDDLLRLAAIIPAASQVELYYLPQSASSRGAASHESTRQAASLAARALKKVKVFPVEDYGDNITASAEGITV